MRLESAYKYLLLKDEERSDLTFFFCWKRSAPGKHSSTGQPHKLPFIPWF
jgi:hypothetical protein